MKRIRSLALIIFLVLSLSLNVATVAFGTVAVFLSNVFEVVTGASSVVSSLKAKNDALDRRLIALKKDLALKETRIATLTTQARNPTVTYRGAKQPLNAAVSDTVTRMSKRTTIAASRNVSSLFASSIPFVGVSVAVTVTAYELKDGCDNLKDLRALEIALDPRSQPSEDEKQVCGMTPPTKEEVIAKIKSAPKEVWDGAKDYVSDLPELDFGGAWVTGLERAGAALDLAGDTATGVGQSVANGVRSGWNWVWGN